VAGRTTAAGVGSGSGSGSGSGDGDMDDVCGREVYVVSLLFSLAGLSELHKATTREVTLKTHSRTHLLYSLATGVFFSRSPSVRHAVCSRCWLGELWKGWPSYVPIIAHPRPPPSRAYSGGKGRERATKVATVRPPHRTYRPLHLTTAIRAAPADLRAPGPERSLLPVRIFEDLATLRDCLRAFPVSHTLSHGLTSASALQLI